MNRRDFLHRTVAAAGLGTAAITPHALGLDGHAVGSPQHVGQHLTHGDRTPHQAPTLTLASRLQPGMTIGLIAPASNGFEDQDIEFAMDIVRSLGFKVKPGAHLFDRFGYLAGTDAARASDLNAMFKDPGVDAIFCARGGFGASKLLPLIDYDAIARNPKVLLGYSDITALHMAIAAKGGFVTLHGPNAGSAWGKSSWDIYRDIAFDAGTPLFVNPEGDEDRLTQRRWRTRVLGTGTGKAQGKLLGGNLTVLTALAGTPYLPDFNGAILFLEDVDEAEYRIDRMLTQLG